MGSIVTTLWRGSFADRHFRHVRSLFRIAKHLLDNSENVDHMAVATGMAHLSQATAGTKKGRVGT